MTIWVPSTFAQDVDFVLSGYGTTGYEAQVTGDLQHDFMASLTPVMLFQMGDDVLFEGEIDFEFDGTSTATTLEHAQVHYLGLERAQLTTGKFHLPFGIWMHPSWINKMPGPPLLYGHAHGGVAEETLLPILFDVGAMAKGKQRLSDTWALGGALWVSQGPMLATGEDEDDHGHEETGHHARATAAHDEDGHGHPAIEVPQVGYGINYADNNTNKMVGARLRLMNRWRFMVDLSGFHAAYDPEGRLAVNGANLSVKWQPGELDFRGEGILLRQEFFREHAGHEHAHTDHAHTDALGAVYRGGYYLQATRRFGAYEPVVRWSHLLASHVRGAHVQDPRQQLAVGLNYWITPSIPVKVAYEWGLGSPDSVLAQWAFGF